MNRLPNSPYDNQTKILLDALVMELYESPTRRRMLFNCKLKCNFPTNHSICKHVSFGNCQFIWNQTFT